MRPRDSGPLPRRRRAAGRTGSRSSRASPPGRAREATHLADRLRVVERFDARTSETRRLPQSVMVPPAGTDLTRRRKPSMPRTQGDHVLERTWPTEDDGMRSVCSPARRVRTCRGTTYTPRGERSSSATRMRSRIETMPTTFPSSTTGRCRKPPWIIERCGVVGRVTGLDRVGMPRHPLRRGGAAVLARGDRLHHVALGEDRGDALALEDDDRADPALRHPRRRLTQRRVGVDREQALRHVVGDERHAAILRCPRWRMPLTHAPPAAAFAER